MVEILMQTLIGLEDESGNISKNIDLKIEIVNFFTLELQKRLTFFQFNPFFREISF